MYNLELYNGVKIPAIGFGTGTMTMKWPKITPFGESHSVQLLNKVANKVNDRIQCRKVQQSIEDALHYGYRLIDWSATYGRGELIRNAVKRSGLAREELFLTSRVSNKQQYSGNVRDGFFETINALGVEYLDLFMFHWPVTDHFIDTYKEMEKLYKEGYVRAIGVCNCKEHHLQRIFDECEIVPAIDQFEIHPLFTQKSLIQFCKQHNIQVMAYTPLARNDDRLRKNLILKELCEKYNKNWGQIVLRWDIQQGIIPIPRSSNPVRLATNLDVFDFELDSEEMSLIDSINIDSRLRFDPDNVDFRQC